MYIAVQWPLRYAAISEDGTLLAVAGRSGLTHYSSNTGRWKLFTNEEEELAFTVKGGMAWYHHVLIVAVESNRGHEVRPNNATLPDTRLTRPHTIASHVFTRPRAVPG